MPKALIAVQAEQISDAQLRTLDALVQQLYQRHVSFEKLFTIWNLIPAGQAFTNYRDSTSSLITMECANNFPQEKRVALMTELEKAWREITGQCSDDVMLALVEEDLFAELFESNQKRLSLGGRLSLILSMLRAFVRARLGGAPVSFNPNL